MSAPVKVTAEQLGIDAGEEHDGTLDFDIGNLMAYDASPVEAATFSGGIDSACHAMATRIFQALTRQLFNLPSEAAPEGRIAQLPAPTTILPREKPIPKPKAPTKWELFAQKKGIVKRKRSKLEYDEASGEWRRRYGYERANDAQAVPVIEAKPGEQTGVEDPFTKLNKDKKERVKKQDAQQLANLKLAAKAGGKGAIPPTLKLAASLPEHGRGKPTKRKEMQAEIKAVTRQVTASTASMGKFDRIIAGEDLKERARAMGAIRKRKVLSVTATKQERAEQGKLVDQILRKNADDIVDIGRAIGKFEAAAREEKKEYRSKNKGANKGLNKKGRLGVASSGVKKPGRGGKAAGQKGGKKTARG